MRHNCYDCIDRILNTHLTSIFIAEIFKPAIISTYSVRRIIFNTCYILKIKFSNRFQILSIQSSTGSLIFKFMLPKRKDGTSMESCSTCQILQKEKRKT